LQHDGRIQLPLLLV
jgi:hypothetical protein